jgi:hypothetical protein
VCGGSPHIHLACTEAYVVTAGEGTVQTLTVEDGFTETLLEPGVIAWFTPGTVHRMTSGREGGGLRVTVLMQNSGLPEAGDAVFTFPPEVLNDPDAYATAAALPAKEGPEAERAQRAARERRDLAVAGYLRLRASIEDGDTAPLHDFHRAAARLVGPKLAAWQPRWRDGALAAAGTHRGAARRPRPRRHVPSGGGARPLGGADPAGRIRDVRTPRRIRTPRRGTAESRRIAHTVRSRPERCVTHPEGPGGGLVQPNGEATG